MPATATARLKYSPVIGAQSLFVQGFIEYLVMLHDEFTPRVHDIRARRAALLEKTHREGLSVLELPVTEVNTGDWQVPPVPEELKRAGIEITGPASVTSMFINALNPGPDGARAEGDLDDDEDSAGHRFVDTVRATHNRVAAIERRLTFNDPVKGRVYRIQEGELPFFMHRERGLHLDEPQVVIEGTPVPAAILGTALTLFYAGRAHIEQGQGIYFYLPKMELVEEAALWRDFFDTSREFLGFPQDAVIRAIALIESLPAVYSMEEMLHALGSYAAGLNAARWDLKASILEYVMADPDLVWPDRFGVDVKTTKFLSDIFKRLVAVCLKRGAVAIGGMATALPNSNEEVNKAASQSIRADKEWEAQQGFLRGWVAHIHHMKAAAEPFKELRGTGWQPTPEMRNPDNYPIEITKPEGPITIEGTRRNVRTIIEYVEGWLNGRGAKGIDSLAGKPGVHPALMEDLATARISVAQTAQRIRFKAADSAGGETHDFGLVKRLLHEEVQDILRLVGKDVDRSNQRSVEAYSQTELTYLKAVKVSMQWIKNYTEFNYRSLGAYTRHELDEIAAAPDAF
jgi:malate synthase